MSLASCTAGAVTPILGGAAPACDVLKKVGVIRSKSFSARILSSRTEPTMPRQPMMPTGFMWE